LGLNLSQQATPFNHPWMSHFQVGPDLRVS
jgi:hypothetical protein